MIGGLKTIVVKASYELEFEKLFAELRVEVEREEPGCMLYSLMRSRTNSLAYIVQEQYLNQEALTAHEKSAHGARYFPKIREILDEITVEYFDIVVK